MNRSVSDAASYSYESLAADHTHAYLWATVFNLLDRGHPSNIFEFGCGNGAFAMRLAERGIPVVGVDPSEQGIRLAKQRQSTDGSPRLEVGNAYDELASLYGQFPCVISLEVVEHVYFPRKFAACVNSLLAPGGMAIISTPYHSYWKNLALAVAGKMDSHFTALWDHGHIKFWSVKTLTQLFAEQGLRCEAVHRVGRFPVLAKSMILVFRKPNV